MVNCICGASGHQSVDCPQCSGKGRKDIVTQRRKPGYGHLASPLAGFQTSISRWDLGVHRGSRRRPNRCGFAAASRWYVARQARRELSLFNGESYE